MSTFNNQREAIYADKDIGALTCASKTCSDMPDLVKDIITNYTKSMYVSDRRKYDLAERAKMCVRVVREKELDEIGAAQEDLAYARLWYENEVRDTEKMYYENKGKATDEALEAAMETRQQLEDQRYQNYLREANNYNSILEDKKEILKTTGYTWGYVKETIDERAEDRLFIAQEWVTQREIDDGLWDPAGYSEDEDALSQQPDAPIHPMDPDGPAIGCGCWGCAENQPNQQAHMGPGGCLHMPSGSEEEEDSTDPCADCDSEDYYLSDDEPWWISRYEDRLDRW